MENVDISLKCPPHLRAEITRVIAQAVRTLKPGNVHIVGVTDGQLAESRHAQNDYSNTSFAIVAP